MRIIDKIKTIIWICIISSVIYAIFPTTLALFLGKYNLIISIICVYFINVIYSFVSGLILTKKKGFSFSNCIILGLIFIPWSLIIYNLSTVYYSILYIFICLISSLICYKNISKIK